MLGRKVEHMLDGSDRSRTPAAAHLGAEYGGERGPQHRGGHKTADIETPVGIEVIDHPVVALHRGQLVHERAPDGRPNPHWCGSGPDEVVTLELLHALKGGSNRAFYRWLTRDYRPLFPRLPERTRLFRLFVTHHDWTTAFLATPTVLGLIDTYGSSCSTPCAKAGARSRWPKGLSNHRWIVGGKGCLVVNQYGLVVAWACNRANTADNTFQWLIRQFDERMIVLSDTAFHAPEGDPANLKLCRRGE